MARPLQIQIVERARTLIADKQHWCRGELARDVSGEGVCPTSASAVKRCALGAVIAAAHELTHDLDFKRFCIQSPASTIRHRHTGSRQRHERTCGCARAVRYSHLSGERLGVAR